MWWLWVLASGAWAGGVALLAHHAWPPYPTFDYIANAEIDSAVVQADPDLRAAVARTNGEWGDSVRLVQRLHRLGDSLLAVAIGHQPSSAPAVTLLREAVRLAEEGRIAEQRAMITSQVLWFASLALLLLLIGVVLGIRRLQYVLLPRERRVTIEANEAAAVAADVAAHRADMAEVAAQQAIEDRIEDERFAAARLAEQVPTHVCERCGGIGRPVETKRGDGVLEVLLWLVLLMPGFIYSLWRANSKRWVCAFCAADALVPRNSPRGRALEAQWGQPGPQADVAPGQNPE